MLNRIGRGIMKTAVVLLLSLAAASFAADPKPNPVKEPDTRLKTEKSDEVKRLGAVTWDLDTHKLVWVVQKGSMVDGQFVTESEQKYEISPDKALMAVEDEARGFDGDEAVSLHQTARRAQSLLRGERRVVGRRTGHADRESAGEPPRQAEGRSGRQARQSRTARAESNPENV